MQAFLHNYTSNPSPALACPLILFLFWLQLSLGRESKPLFHGVQMFMCFPRLCLQWDRAQTRRVTQGCNQALRGAGQGQGLTTSHLA